MSTLEKAPLTQPQPPEDDGSRHVEQYPKKPNWIKRIIGGVAILVVVAGGTEVIHLATTPSEKAKASHSAGPNKSTGTNKSSESNKTTINGPEKIIYPSIKSLQLVNGDATSIATQLTERISNRTTAGASTELYKKLINRPNSLSFSGYLNQVTDQEAVNFDAAILPSNWNSVPTETNVSDVMTRMNFNFLNDYITSYPDKNVNQFTAKDPALTTSYSFDKVLSSKTVDGVTTISSDFTIHDNSAETVLNGKGSQNGDPEVMTFTEVLENGTPKITSLDITPEQ
jgi:hypothetical protein